MIGILLVVLLFFLLRNMAKFKADGAASRTAGCTQRCLGSRIAQLQVQKPGHCAHELVCMSMLPPAQIFCMHHAACCMCLRMEPAQKASSLFLASSAHGPFGCIGACTNAPFAAAAVGPLLVSAGMKVSRGDKDKTSDEEEEEGEGEAEEEEEDAPDQGNEKDD